MDKNFVILISAILGFGFVTVGFTTCADKHYDLQAYRSCIGATGSKPDECLKIYEAR